MNVMQHPGSKWATTTVPLYASEQTSPLYGTGGQPCVGCLCWESCWTAACLVHASFRWLAASGALVGVAATLQRAVSGTDVTLRLHSAEAFNRALGSVM
jgi:hypothetical protein